MRLVQLVDNVSDVYTKKERLISLSFLNKPKISFLSMIKYPTEYLMIELSLIPLSPISSTMTLLKPKKLIIDLIISIITESFEFYC